jgi:hypothetical protein
VDVVEVAVGDADGVDARDLVVFGIGRVSLDPGVHEDDLARGEFELE